MTGAVVGLLGIAIVIALVGIANTLGLSVLERGRENALLRAMGLTRSQLRRAMAAEGLLLSGVATVLGTALGLVFAWVGVEVLIGTVVDDAGMTVPVRAGGRRRSGRRARRARRVRRTGAQGGPGDAGSGARARLSALPPLVEEVAQRPSETRSGVS